MLSPEIEQMGARSAKAIGASPVTLYLTTDNVDKVVAKAVKLGAMQKGPVMDMFWVNTWRIATHKTEPTPQEMKKMMKEQMRAQAAAGTATAS